MEDISLVWMYSRLIDKFDCLYDYEYKTLASRFWDWFDSLSHYKQRLMTAIVVPVAYGVFSFIFCHIAFLFLGI
jgi:hypothetical protein